MNTQNTSIPEDPADDFESLFRECQGQHEYIVGEFDLRARGPLSPAEIVALNGQLEPMSNSVESLLEYARSPEGHRLPGEDNGLRAEILGWIPDARLDLEQIDDDLAPTYDAYEEEIEASEDVTLAAAYIVNLLNDLQQTLEALAPPPSPGPDIAACIAALKARRLEAPAGSPPTPPSGRKRPKAKD